MVLCGANSYTQKFYLGEQFSRLPETVKEELKILCVIHVEDVGGILILESDEDGNLDFRVEAEDADYLYDEIGSALKIKQMRQERQELWESLELFYRSVFMTPEKLRGNDER